MGIFVSFGATVEIQDNIIEDANDAGISIEGGSFAILKNNTVRNNFTGVRVTEGSAARIGTDCSDPNTIMDNAANGIELTRNSEAVILGNTILDNTGSGIAISDNSMADTASNDISGNGDNGVDVERGSSVRMGSAGGGACRSTANSTDGGNLNTGDGIQCRSLSTVTGELGTLNGSVGAEDIDNTFPGCFEDLI